MPRDYSNIQCNNCRAYGHIKRACPGLRTFNVGIITVCNEKENKNFYKKAEESLKKEIPSNSRSNIIGHVGDITAHPAANKSNISVKKQGTRSNSGKKKNFSSRNPVNAPKQSFKQEDSDSDDDSSNSNYCSICETNEHDEMDCFQEEMMAFNYTCYYCDKTGHFEDKCPSFLKAAKKQDAEDKKWRQKWGKKIQKNKKLLQSMTKQPATHCQYCYSIHHDTEFCYLATYGIKEDLKI